MVDMELRMVDMVATVDTPHRKISNSTVDVRSKVLDKPGKDTRVTPVVLVVPTKRKNPAPVVLPKKNGLSDLYGRKENNCVEDAPKAG
jgi:hypothetical protein